jgi:hypothetical protein
MTVRILAAATLYFLIVFGVGFLLGPIRVFWLEPRIGPLAAVACETPFLLAATVIAARAAPRVARLEPRASALLAVGMVALVIQQIADLTVGLTLRGISIAGQLARFATPEGAIYAVLLILFAIMPALRNPSSGS